MTAHFSGQQLQTGEETLDDATKRIFEAMRGVFGKENVAWAQVYGRVAIRRELPREKCPPVTGKIAYYNKLGNGLHARFCHACMRQEPDWEMYQTFRDVHKCVRHFHSGRLVDCSRLPELSRLGPREAVGASPDCRARRHQGVQGAARVVSPAP